MSFFKDIVTDINNVEEKFLGPDYKYYKKVPTPGSLGVSSDGNIKALGKDIEAIVKYVEVLVSGDGKPLGNKFFIETGGQCKDYKTNKLVNRSMYINNIPTKDIPIISDLTGMSFDSLRGIVPGIMEDMYSINPIKMFSAFMEGSEPLCAEVKLDVTDENDNILKKSAFIPISEIKDMVGDGIIPKETLTGEMSRSLNKKINNPKESFINFCDSIHNKSIINDDSIIENSSNIKNIIQNNINKLNKRKNIGDKIFYSLFSLLLLYFIMKLLKKWR